jgi:hypothetical protein
MKVQRRKNELEKRIMVAMIVDPVVLGAIAPKWDKEACKSKWAAIVGSWCVKYFTKYNKAPRQTIWSLFQSWAEDHSDQETVELIDKFLRGVGDKYKALAREINSEYMIDQASGYFDRNRALKVTSTVEGHIENGDLAKAIKTIEEFRPIELGMGSGIDVLSDKAAYFRAFEKKSDPVFTYEGDLGNFLNKILLPGRLISFMGREKIGKTRWLVDFSWRAMLNRKRVVFISAGDMSEDEMELLFSVRAARHPQDSEEEVLYPKKIITGFPSATVTHKIKKFPDGLSRIAGWKALTAVRENKLKTDQSYLKLFCYPNGSVSIEQITSMLHMLAKRGWPADIVAIDYADILAAMDGKVETRHQINATWMGMKKLTQSLHCVVVTATQSDADSYGTVLLDLTNFSEDKRKYAHVNAMIGLNATEEEVEQGLTRLNILQGRGFKFNRRRVLHVAGCPALCNPAILSTF